LNPFGVRVFLLFQLAIELNPKGDQDLKNESIESKL